MKELIERAYDHLKQIPGYPCQEEKDIPFLQDLLTEFPSLGLINEIKQWKTWLLDNTDSAGGQNLDIIKGKRINYRARLRRWCSNASKWKDRKEENNIRKGNMKKCEFEKELPARERNVKEVW